MWHGITKLNSNRDMLGSALCIRIEHRSI